MAEGNDINCTKTIEYYEMNATEYVKKTEKCDMANLYHEFEKVIPSKCKILDLGCGSGRDSAYFSSIGNDVVSIDASSVMCEQAKKRTQNPVIQLRIEEIDYTEEFDAIWACASLLHISRNKIKSVILKLYNALKKNGILYASWKLGNEDVVYADRLFSNYDEPELRSLFTEENGFRVQKIWVTEDVNGREEKWINMLAVKC